MPCVAFELLFMNTTQWACRRATVSKNHKNANRKCAYSYYAKVDSGKVFNPLLLQLNLKSHQFSKMKKKNINAI